MKTTIVFRNRVPEVAQMTVYPTPDPIPEGFQPYLVTSHDGHFAAGDTIEEAADALTDHLSGGKA